MGLTCPVRVWSPLGAALPGVFLSSCPVASPDKMNLILQTHFGLVFFCVFPERTPASGLPRTLSLGSGSPSLHTGSRGSVFAPLRAALPSAEIAVFTPAFLSVFVILG